jgi:hypothetical protein
MSYVHDEYAYDNAVAAKIRRNMRAKFERMNPDANDIINFLYGASSWSTFAKSLANSYDDRGGLSEGQVNAARGMMAKSAARAAERLAQRNAPATSGQHVGTIGQREEFTLTINRVMELDGMYGVTYFHTCTDVAGAIIVYKGSAELGEVGATVRVKATIKEHTAYNGVAQTIINRPKVL